jgi:FlaA1/EpsC-like NDP-sugar epimerase
MIGDLIFKVRNRHFFVLDIVAFTVTPILSIFLRTGDITSFSIYGEEILLIVPVYLILKIIVLYSLGLYSRLWRYASIDEVVKISLSGVLIIFLEYFITFKLFHNFLSINIFIPRSIPIIDGMLTTLYISFSRLSIRILERIDQRFAVYEKVKKVLIIGAGKAGVIIAQEMQSNKSSGLLPIGFVDDDPQKQNMRIRGINVLGTINNIRKIVEPNNPDLIVLAIPSAKGTRIREILESLKDINIEKLTMPSLFELVNGRISIDRLRKINIEDLLRRDQIKTDLTFVESVIKTKNVLITGAGGSIGSEIIRQIIKFNPNKILLLGHGENSIYQISRELQENIGFNNFEKLIGDIRDYSRMDHIFNSYKPEIVYHTAAHKHVELMEKNIPEAISNNVFGTINLLKLGVVHNVEKMILISTDKAVKPSSIMGVTKRIAELAFYLYANQYNKNYVSVRFGNVLGSRGSVVPIFQDQLRRGGTITLTHPDVKRYFMTIPEAVQLVLQASALGTNNETFVLEMGEPIKILDLAKDMVKLSGLVLDEDIKLEIIGLKEGEKIFEEIKYEGEAFSKTDIDKIYRLMNPIHNISASSNDYFIKFQKQLGHLKSIIDSNDHNELVKYLSEIIPEYKKN